eukprot:15470707-Alexandrium_andersonii.AAC.1
MQSHAFASVFVCMRACLCACLLAGLRAGELACLHAFARVQVLLGGRGRGRARVGQGAMYNNNCAIALQAAASSLQ